MPGLVLPAHPSGRIVPPKTAAVQPPSLLRLPAATAPGGYWLVASFFLLGLCGAGQTAAAAPFMMRVFPRGKRVGYITLSNLALGPLRFVVPLIAGLVSQVFGYGVLFAAAGVFPLLALLPLWLIRLGPEPPADDVPPGPADGRTWPAYLPVPVGMSP
ncbi:MAG: hypothetical protein B1H04_01255 [Planctomycetales bacterium 4484_123]|nr:MAG: hypothetical protein B1H04_01255 [Planctomycetales bacterium 4484_123]